MEDEKRQKDYMGSILGFLRRAHNTIEKMEYFKNIPDKEWGNTQVAVALKNFNRDVNQFSTELAKKNIAFPQSLKTPEGVLSAFGGFDNFTKFEEKIREIGARTTEEQNQMMRDFNATRKSAWAVPPKYENTEAEELTARFLGNTPDALTIRPIEGDVQPIRVSFGNVQAAQQPQPVAQPTTQAPAQTQTAPVAPPLSAAPEPVVPPLAEPVVSAPTPAPVTTSPATTPAPVAAAPANPFLQGGIPVGTATPVATTPVSAPVAAAPVTTTTTGTNMATLNPEELPALRSAGGGGTSAIDPTLRPYLELGLRAAEQQFLQTQPQFFPGQTYVSPSQQTLDALAAQEQIARSAPTTLQAAQESYMRGLGGLGATAGGAFLMGNPYQQQMIEAASRPIMQQFTQQTLPGIASGFSGAGRYGSGAMERALGQATEATSRALGDVGTNIAFQDYSAERGRQQQAILGQITAAGQAPQIYGQQFLPSQQLAQIGAAREAISALPLQEQMQRFQFAQQAPAQQLQSFLSSVYGTPMASSQYAPQQQAQTNRFGNVLGGAATGAAIGSMTGFGAGVGAGVGALGGLLL